MEIRERFFFLEQEPCVIHLPEKPNGFGVLILGDYNHFVESGTSLWMQHVGKAHLLEALRNEGYTVFTSNLYGRHWGSDKAVRLAKRLYHVVMKKEILNERIHIIAEGMGALVALDMMATMPESIRSAVMLHPCLDLPRHLELEREHKFFYKRLLRELKAAYEASEEEVPAKIYAKTFRSFSSHVPVRMFVPTSERKERKMIVREYEQLQFQSGHPISLSFHVQEAKYKVVRSILQAFHMHEADL